MLDLDQAVLARAQFAKFRPDADTIRELEPGANEARISDNPLRIPPLFSHYSVTIWSQLSDSNYGRSALSPTMVGSDHARIAGHHHLPRRVGTVRPGATPEPSANRESDPAADDSAADCD